ncbi:unnamed protein product [Rotaria sp. Silwood2]|nr:unnamed protein product [Rotaria sp. Silwood2]
MAYLVLLAVFLSLTVSMVSGGTFAACVNSNGVNCFQRSCPKGDCCNFKPDMKNNMASGWVDNKAGCTIYYNSGCKGSTYFMNSLTSLNCFVIAPFEPAQSIEELRDANHFIHIIDQFERRKSEAPRVIVPLFDTMKDKFQFVLDYLSNYSTHRISEWNTNDLAQGNVSLFAKVSLLMIFAFRHDLSYSVTLVTYYVHRIGRINDLFKLHMSRNEYGLFQLDVNNCFIDFCLKDIEGNLLSHKTGQNYNELKKMAEDLQQRLEQCQKENDEMKKTIATLEKNMRDKQNKDIVPCSTADEDQGEAHITMTEDFDQVSLNQDYTVHRPILDTHISNEQNSLLTASVQIPKEGTANDSTEYGSERRESGDFGLYNAKINIELKINHDVEVNRADYMPQNSSFIATNSPCNKNRKKIGG